MNDERTGGTSLSLPVQAAPVYRTSLGGAGIGSGVEASGWFDDVLDVVKTVGDVAGTVGKYAGPIAGGLGALGI
jgi:hypothetical protein